GTLKVFDVASGKLLRTLPGNRQDMPFVQVHPLLAAPAAVNRSRGPSLNLWDIRTWEKKVVPDVNLTGTDMRFTGAYSLDRLGREAPEPTPGKQPRRSLLACSADGKTLAAVGHFRDEDGKQLPPEVNLWDRDGRRLATLRGHDAVIQAVAWSHDGKTLATAGL